MFYIGNMQQKVNIRMNQHLGEVYTLVNKIKYPILLRNTLCNTTRTKKQNSQLEMCVKA